MGKGLEKFKAQAEKAINEGNEKSKAYRQQTYGAMLKHIEEVCDEEYDALLAQEHKTFERMFQFVKDKARAAAVGGCAMIDDPTVYGWIDEYVGTDDKAKWEKRESQKQAAPAKPKKKDDGQQELDLFDDGEQDDEDGEEAKPAVPAPKPTPKKKDDAQMDFFDMMK